MYKHLREFFKVKQAGKLAEQVGMLRREISTLRERNTDLDAQVRSLLAAQPITVSERAEIARIRFEHTQLIVEQSEIIVYIRNNFSDEMKKGAFRGMGAAQMVCKLLERLKVLEDEERERKKYARGN